MLDKKNSSVAVLGLAAAVESALVQVREIFETRRRVEVTLRYSAEQKGTLLGKVKVRVSLALALTLTLTLTLTSARAAPPSTGSRRRAARSSRCRPSPNP